MPLAEGRVAPPESLASSALQAIDPQVTEMPRVGNPQPETFGVGGGQGSGLRPAERLWAAALRSKTLPAGSRFIHRRGFSAGETTLGGHLPLRDCQLPVNYPTGVENDPIG
ncbi:hypothetical protein Poly41_55350 [Novipirellula artificiosorum]|uniref:Uncharacterized protein n=1 Tax=Novipirellula artificiosorum TaxID=2528016 RepID=A0A5C6DA20_9BACT|nr:hypothetical protein Poly41_55350 [Novipirellula artificiosorum]